ncbi:hypothetical protein [Bradyrhizobium embrapense]
MFISGMERERAVIHDSHNAMCEACAPLNFVLDPSIWDIDRESAGESDSVMGTELDDYRWLERVCRQDAERAILPESRRTLLFMADQYRAAIEQATCYRDCYPNPCGALRKAAAICGEVVQRMLQNKVVKGMLRSSGGLIPALQNRVHQFNSGRGLHSSHQWLAANT